jgi:hypothetical protein
MILVKAPGFSNRWGNRGFDGQCDGSNHGAGVFQMRASIEPGLGADRIADGTGAMGAISRSSD